MFRVGQKCVCINASGIRQTHKLLSKDHVYTIREIIPLDKIGPEHFLLCEITNEIAAGDNREYSYVASRFRPIVERKTDISIFREILRKATKKVGESARAVEQAKGGEG